MAFLNWMTWAYRHAAEWSRKEVYQLGGVVFTADGRPVEESDVHHRPYFQAIGARLDLTVYALVARVAVARTHRNKDARRT